MNNLTEALAFAWKQVDGYVGRRLIIALLLVAASGLCSAAAPVLFKLMVDAYDPSLTNVLHWAPLWLAGAYAFSQYLFKCLGTLRQWAHSLGWQRLYRYLSRALVAHVFNLPLRFHVERKTGAVSETLNQGTGSYEVILQHLLYTFLPILIEFLGILGVLIYLDRVPYLAIMCAAAIGYTIVFKRGAASVTEPSDAISAAYKESNAVLTDCLLNYETVKFFNGEQAVVKLYDSSLIKTESVWGLYLKRLTVNGLLVATVFFLSLGASLGLASHEVMQSTMTVGDLVLINSYVLRLVQPLEEVGYAVRNMAEKVSFLKSMLALVHERPELDGPCISSSSAPAPGKLQFERVQFSYRDDTTTVNDVSFTIFPGKRTALVGASGSGKSTVVKLLFRLYDPQRGRILLDDWPITQMALSELRQRIAVVPQETALFNDSLRFNIAFGKSGATQEEVEHAARIAHLHDFIVGLPQRYDSPVGERGVKLSGGERQRVAIARAVIKRPQIFIFDEATSSLDTATEREILGNLEEASQGCTTLMIAHRLSTVVHADQILVLENGCIVERGTHTALLRAHGRYAALWRAQQSAEAEQRVTEHPFGIGSSSV